MPRSIFLWVVLIALAGWLVASYGLRYGVMENTDWVGICADQAERWECQFRGSLGLAIHYQVMAIGAVVCALPAFFLAGRMGRSLAWLSLVFAIPALVLYTTTLAAFAVVLGALRLVRTPRSLA